MVNTQVGTKLTNSTGRNIYGKNMHVWRVAE